MNQKPLPRLVYLADVPVEATYHGSALLYRLLQDYPRGRLLILQPTGVGRRAGRRLSGAPYREISFGNQKLLHSRFARYYRTWLMFTARRITDRICKESDGFKADAVLTVAHGFSWIGAAAFAALKGLPLYVIVHDDWPRVTDLAAVSRSRIDRLFGRIIKCANITFCVSPAMQETYQNRYAARTCLLYPSQSKNSLPAEDSKLVSRGDQLVVAFAGTINSGGYARLLRLVAQALSVLNGKLVLFGPHTSSSLRQWGLVSQTLENRGLIDSDEIGSILRSQANVLLVPMSFASNEKENMSLGFPSKIPEYAATGVPMLIFGPKYCSAVQWAQSQEPVAEVVISETKEDLIAALNRLRSASYREHLGQKALAVGHEFFSNEAVTAKFLRALVESDSPR